MSLIDFTPQLSAQHSDWLDNEAQRAQIEAKTIAEFNRDMLEALFNEPQKLMRYGEGGRKLAPAAEFFSDFLGKDNTVCLLRILADGAKGQDVSLRICEMLGQCAKEYAEYHGADAAEEA